MLRDEITACCKALKLGQNLIENNDNVEAESHEEYLLEPLKLEVERRTANRKEQRLKNAGFYAIETFPGYTFDEIKLPFDLTPQDFQDCNFVEEKKNLMMQSELR